MITWEKLQIMSQMTTKAVNTRMNQIQKKHLYLYISKI